MQASSSILQATVNCLGQNPLKSKGKTPEEIGQTFEPRSVPKLEVICKPAGAYHF